MGTGGPVTIGRVKTTAVLRAAPVGAVEDCFILTDEELIGAIVEGRADALAILYDRYGRVAYGLALRLMGSPGRAEEVVQEAFWRVWRGAASFDARRSKPGTWVLSIVHLQAIDHLRRLRRRPDETNDLTLAGDFADPDPDPIESAWRSEQRSLIEAALAELPPLQREAVELAYFGGLSQSQIAARQQAPISTVKTRLQLGLKKLGEALQRHRHDWAGTHDDG